MEHGGIDIEEGFVTIVYAQYRGVAAQLNETHVRSYCCVQPFGRGLLSGFSGSPVFTVRIEDVLDGAAAWEETGLVIGPRG